LKKNTFADNKTPVSEKFLDAIIRRRPRYADLTGGVEKDADHVVIPFRPEVFLKEHEPTRGTELYGVWEAKVNAWRGKAQLVLALSRERDWPAHVDVGWSGASTSFYEMGSDNPERYEPAQEFSADPMRLF
jgi:replicative DNA helicase